MHLIYNRKLFTFIKVPKNWFYSYYLVWVYSDAKEARVSVNELIDVSNSQIPKDRCIIEVCQVGHVSTTVKLGRIHLTNLVFLEDFFLKYKIGFAFGGRN